MNPADNIKRFFKNASVSTNPKADDEILDKLIQAHGEAADKERTRPEANTWRIIMHSKITKLATAAVIAIAAITATHIWNRSIPVASAAAVFDNAVKALSNLKSVHIKSKMRAPGGGDNFSTIGTEYDFVPIELWKQFDEDGGKWRLQNQQRVMVCDGDFVIQLIMSTYAYKAPAHDSRQWFPLSVLDVDKTIERELELARKYGSDFELFRETGQDGREKMIVTVVAEARGDFTNDYLKNKGFEESDNTRIYTFDAETNLLENLEIYINTDQKDVLVFEITSIEYNTYLDPALFILDIPSDAIWFTEPQELPDNQKYQKMTPKETATAFLQACADEDWDEFLKFWMMSDVDANIKAYLGGIEIISVGEPFKSGLYPGWFVPYEIKMPDGQIKKHNLAIRNDNPARRYIVDGGI